MSLSPLSKGSGLITGPYDIPAATLRSRAVFTNTMPTNAYRVSGRPEVTFAIERLIDTAADRARHRPGASCGGKNLIKPKAMPYRNAVGMLYDSGTYEANLDLALDIADGDGFPARKREAKKRGRLLGLGIAAYVESSIGSPSERTQITVQPEGRVDVVIGTQPSGQGHETSFAQVVSDLLAVPGERVKSSSAIPTSSASAAARTPAARCATPRRCSPRRCRTWSPRARQSRRWSSTRRRTRSSSKTAAFARDSNRSFDFLALAGGGAAALPPGTEGRARGRRRQRDARSGVPERLRDLRGRGRPETGAVVLTRYAAVDDVGRCINPLIVHGQTHGGIAQGVGQALWEQCYVDPYSGQPLTGSFMDYGMPRADNLPSFTAEIVEVLSPTNPLGIKAGGEGGTTPALAAVVSAIVDALRDYGIRDITMPATPFTIWQAIQNAKAARS